ncbi:MAG: nucleoside hydrolase [Thermomicrobiales bacterium]|nr:nucleoside hydrolase [Thermomicrobiales bacterium]
MTSRTPIVLDVDTGIDDAMALALAVRSPEVDLVAVTTLAGNVDVTTTTTNTLNVLDWLGRPDVPVFRGASRPLLRAHRDAAYFHDANGLGGARVPASERTIALDKGPAAIVRLARERPGEITLVCVGPLTNLAIALNVEPDLGERLRGVVIMGGAFGVPGNVTPYAEFNIFADPEAAQQVFLAGLPRLTAIGLDVTHQTELSRAVWEATAVSGTKDMAARLVVKVSRRAFEVPTRGKNYLHDPLALAVAFDPNLVVCDDAAVVVDTDDERRGETTLVGPGKTRVARAVDAPRFTELFERRLGLVIPKAAIAHDATPAPGTTG